MSENRLDCLTVIIKVNQEDEDVIHVNDDFLVDNQILEDLVHHGLECCWAVCKAEEHDEGFEQSAICPERGFPFVAFLDTDVVVSPADVKLGEVASSSEVTNDVGDQR